MILSLEQIQEKMRRLVLPNRPGRRVGADEVTDWLSVYDTEDGDSLSRILEVLLRYEVEGEVREAQMNALIVLTERNLVPPDVIDRIARQSTHDDPWFADYVAALQDE